MIDSGDMFGEEPPPEELERPSAAELEEAGQTAMFAAPADPAQPVASAPPADLADGVDIPVPKKPDIDTGQPYRVLARKYRPQTFSQLIGQEPMVRTLANAIARDRLAHAFLMTGVRGVGKTSTARLIAKSLNCIGADGQGGPTIDPCGVCEPCRAIAEGRHIDVIEMDAASHTGVDDVREIIEAVRYSAVSARYKIYIIDEVHMLSRNAFNALLKTLEEPPAHVKFLFATTEVDKLPITVLSRTQRFDLRRIPAAMLEQHFASICRRENVEADEEAVALIASAAEGSVRDGLSILDQAIAHADLEGGDDDGGTGGASGTRVTAERVRDMLGLADKGAKRRLFASLLEGDPQALLAGVEQQYALGVEPLALMRAMMDLTHRIAVAQVGKGDADAPTQEEREAIGEWALKLSAGQIHRLWQLLLKGYEEVRGAPDPLVAAQMALLRTLHAADMPDPGKLADTLREAASQASAGSSSDAPAARSAAPAELDWSDLVDRIEQSGALHLANRLRMQVHIIKLESGELVYNSANGFSEDLRPELRDALLAVTDRRWVVEHGDGEGAPTIVQQEEAERFARERALRDHELVKAALAAFPEAELLTQDGAPKARPN